MTIVKNPLEHLCALPDEEVRLRLRAYTPAYDQNPDHPHHWVDIDPSYFGQFVIDFFRDKPGVIWNYGDVFQDDNGYGQLITTMVLYVNVSLIPGNLVELGYDLARWIDFVANNPEIVQPESEYPPDGGMTIPEELASTPVDLQLDQGFQRQIIEQPVGTASKLPYEMTHRTGTVKTPMDFGTFSDNPKTPMGFSYQNPVKKS